MTDAPALADRSVLVLEDEYFIARQICDLLTAAGGRVIGPFSSVADALAAPYADCAVLDINLHGEMQFQLADRLAGQGVPFVFSSGYDRAVLPPRHAHRPFCLKPMLSGQLVGLLHHALR